MKKLKICFVVDNLGFADTAGLSIPILSSLAKKSGHTVNLVEFGRRPRKACREIKSHQPDIIAYSICSNEARRYLYINNRLKKEISFFSLFGGPHPTFFPEFIKNEGVDAVCRGEADDCFPKLLELFGTDRMYEVSNFSFKTTGGEIIENPLCNLVEDLDTLPFPDREIVFGKSHFLAKLPIKSFMAGRGCPFNCTYCFNHIYHSIYRNKGKLTRTKSVGYLINEIKDTLTKFPVSFVKFYDDIFGSDREWLTEFAGRYPKEIGLPYLCFARLNLIDDEYCRLMKKSGCFTVITAIECGNETVRNNVLNRNMTDEQIISGFEKLKKYGIRTYSVNMLGLPGETEKELLQTLHINQKVKTDFADASIFQPFPGTRLAGYCKQNGYVDNDFNDFQSIFSRSVLNFEQSFKDKVYITHKVFSFLVSHPRLNYLLKVFYIMGRIPYFKNLFNLFYRSYYGVAVYRKIYGCRIPIGLCLRGAFSLLFSRSRI